MDITNDTQRFRLELEPLSERAWQRVEARVFERVPDGPLRATRNKSARAWWRCKFDALAASMHAPRRAWRALSERRRKRVGRQCPATSGGAGSPGKGWPMRDRRNVARRRPGARRPAAPTPSASRWLARRVPGA